MLCVILLFIVEICLLANEKSLRSILTATYYSTVFLNPNLVVPKSVSILEFLWELQKNMEPVSRLPETGLIDLGYDLNFEIKNKKNSELILISRQSWEPLP